MVWKHLKDRDPWGNNNNNNQDNNDRGNNNGPPDLDDIFCRLGKKISNLGKSKNIHPDDNFRKRTHSHMRNYLVGIVTTATIVCWIASGFYTIKEAERGVVTRFGRFNHLVGPGLNWKLTFIDDVIAVNIGSVRELTSSGIMLTSDENIVHIEMNLQYRVTNPKCYLFNVTGVDNSLHQAIDSALCSVVGKYTMDYILTEGNNVIRHDTQLKLEEIIRPYNMGIILLDINFQTTSPPEEVREAFEDVIAARENKQQYIHEAKEYANKVQPNANSQAKRILEEARAYRTHTILKAQGEVARFTKILPKYKSAPKIICEHLYIETMEKIFSHTRKIFISNNKSSNLIIFPGDQMLKNSINHNLSTKKDKKETNNLLHFSPISTNKSNIVSTFSAKKSSDIMDQRRDNAKRHDYRY